MKNHGTMTSQKLDELRENYSHADHLPGREHDESLMVALARAAGFSEEELASDEGLRDCYANMAWQIQGLLMKTSKNWEVKVVDPGAFGDGMISIIEVNGTPVEAEYLPMYGMFSVRPVSDAREADDIKSPGCPCHPTESGWVGWYEFGWMVARGEVAVPPESAVNF